MNDLFKSTVFDPKVNPFLNGDFAKLFNLPSVESVVNPVNNVDFSGLLNNVDPVRSVNDLFQAYSYAAEGMKATLVAQGEIMKTISSRLNEAIKEYPVTSDVGEQFAHNARQAHGTLEESLARVNEASQSVIDTSEKLTNVVNKRLSEAVEDLRKASEKTANQLSNISSAPVSGEKSTVSAKAKKSN